MKLNYKKISAFWYFLSAVILAYLFLFIIKPESFFSSLEFFYNIIIKIFPIIILAFVLMALTNYFITPKFLLRHLKGRGVKKWFFVIVAGILSSGPIYMWYPLLADLREKGLDHGLIACFLYNKAIKVPLIPLIVFYFGWRYFIILSIVMISFSIIQGLIINKLMKVNHENSNSL